MSEGLTNRGIQFQELKKTERLIELARELVNLHGFNHSGEHEFVLECLQKELTTHVEFLNRVQDSHISLRIVNWLGDAESIILKILMQLLGSSDS